MTSVKKAYISGLMVNLTGSLMVWLAPRTSMNLWSNTLAPCRSGGKPRTSAPRRRFDRRPRLVARSRPGLKGGKAFRVTKTVAGAERVLVVTDNPMPVPSQWLTLQIDIAKASQRLAQRLEAKWVRNLSQAN